MTNASLELFKQMVVKSQKIQDDVNAILNEKPKSKKLFTLTSPQLKAVETIRKMGLVRLSQSYFRDAEIPIESLYIQYADVEKWQTENINAIVFRSLRKKGVLVECKKTEYPKGEISSYKQCEILYKLTDDLNFA